MEDAITIALRDKHGNVVGSEIYFRALNKGILSGLMVDDRKYNYREALRKSADRIHNILDEISADLKNNIGIVRYIPLNDRKRLIKILEGCAGICIMVSKSTGKSSECIAILNLSSSKTRPASKANENELDAAAKTIRGYSGLSLSERVDILKKVLTRGASSAIGNNAKRALFLKQVERGKGREFLEDACLKFLYANNPKQFTGRCGRVIGSDEYIKHMEKHIFLHGIPNGVLSGDKTYDELVLIELKRITEQIVDDVKNRPKQAKRLSPNNRKNIMEAATELDALIHLNVKNRVEKKLIEIPIEDVTDRLHKLMESTDEKYAFYTQPAFYQSNTGLTESTGNDAVSKIIKFIVSVKSGSVTDIKLSPEWPSRWYIYEGDIIRYDAPGNILFGYVGKLFGYDDKFLSAGAGAYQFYEGHSDWSFWFHLL